MCMECAWVVPPRFRGFQPLSRKINLSLVLRLAGTYGEHSRMDPKLAAKLRILADAAKYDASCASSGAPRRSAARPASARPAAPASATPTRPTAAASRC